MHSIFKACQHFIGDSRGGEKTYLWHFLSSTSKLAFSPSGNWCLSLRWLYAEIIEAIQSSEVNSEQMHGTIAKWFQVYEMMPKIAITTSIAIRSMMTNISNSTEGKAHDKSMTVSD